LRRIENGFTGLLTAPALLGGRGRLISRIDDANRIAPIANLVFS
jgi:hypothetical protein